MILMNCLPENYNFTVGFDADRQDDDRKRYNNDSGTIGALTFDQQEKVSSNGLFAQGSLKSGNWSFSNWHSF